MKKAKKQIKDMVGISMLSAGGSIALGGIGGAAAVHGQQGLSNATRFMGTTGTLAGTGMMMRSIKTLEPKKYKKKK